MVWNRFYSNVDVLLLKQLILMAPLVFLLPVQQSQQTPEQTLRHHQQM